jgi:hypothetical protein
MEMGASLVLRRKTENLGELFIFRNTKKTQNGKLREQTKDDEVRLKRKTTNAPTGR